ncbi:thiamine pyrophosphate-dependent enzyme [Bacillus cereus group sp. BfR-BA-01309]|uniref:thiamine pyrophosphate-dependent enzyme n=1 Tax=Bacillus cereus group sp. BfR-BA-01309 TaxID=2920286 RepID=UPI001F580370|nr:thiamine pyrophosphate-dependent enzyme [Bacillus cereus group sp. BfR-BA-01309]
MISRSDTVRALLEYIERVEGLLVVGNGFLSREAMRLGQRGSILPLQGGMGLASSVGAGLVTGGQKNVVILEGDGNHLMGYSSPHVIGGLGLPILHVVSWNGVYNSTGGQKILNVQPDVNYVAKSFGYEESFEFKSISSFKEWLDSTKVVVPTLVYICEIEDQTTPERIEINSAVYATAYRERLTGGENL